VFSGAISVLTNILNTTFLWFLCWRDMLEIHGGSDWRKDKGLQKRIVCKTPESLPSVKEEV
jgi:hypothetical protein